MVSPSLNKHHKIVTCIARRLVQAMKLKSADAQNIIFAALLHDIGIFSDEERDRILTFEAQGIDVNTHAHLGYELLRHFDPLAESAELIKHHHASYCDKGKSVPLGCYIIHLADRVAVLFDESREVLEQVPEILVKIHKTESVFHPDTLAAFARLTEREYFWIEAASSLSYQQALGSMQLSQEVIDLETLRSFAGIVSQIIDFRSSFTATHSKGVAAVAKQLAGLSGFSSNECAMLEIAGLLHDLGKLAVPNEILEKNGSLSEEEFNIIRKHTYYTYTILNKMSGFKQLARWAAFHHERIDGSGYPFHVPGNEFCKLSRIMAVADVVTALTEDRPYRRGMSREKTESVLWQMANEEKLDADIVKLAIEHFSFVNVIRAGAQLEAKREYEALSSLIDEKRKAPQETTLSLVQVPLKQQLAKNEAFTLA
ncbi:MAG: HD domain-containing protein [Coriobacteriales bacterium]|nr:HD domain-containing protein [Coriobacteriales bacterium]